MLGTLLQEEALELLLAMQANSPLRDSFWALSAGFKVFDE